MTEKTTEFIILHEIFVFRKMNRGLVFVLFHLPTDVNCKDMIMTRRDFIGKF